MERGQMELSQLTTAEMCCFKCRRYVIGSAYFSTARVRWSVDPVVEICGYTAEW